MAVGAEADAQETSSSAGSSLFKKKSRGPRLVRKRSTSPSAAVSRSGEGVGSHGVLEASEPEESTSVVQRKKTSAYNPLRQGTGRKQSSKPAPAHHLDRAGTQSKVQSHAWASAPASTSSAFEYKYAEDEARGAVAVSVDKHYGGDAGQSAKASNADGMYRGKAAYDTYLETRDNGKSSSFNAAAKGPIKATANVRTVTVTDYQPDICKDYKETGYCGFGDTCKFLHDRSDYLAGWQMDSLSNTASRHLQLCYKDSAQDGAEERGQG
ncbi:Predicted E3 ubiquitin ligase [Ceraceosorus bombacis]|uniref:Pre-mRNA-splicing factor CWC24 n=1 Tax=Ceraceosorus bombacis TaxID=401625 RepID=A0A0P1BL55_9BASI|nr:Predicted E3 ubiquitin ligase [Ceraceosorus bombacis]